MKNVIKKPFVSVIMPIYNGSSYMVEAIESILAQTYSNFELVIANDCSTDGTSLILKNYKNNKKIKIINLTSRFGAFGAINKALKQAKGEYIAPMDCDDISHPKRLEKQVNFLEKNKRVIVLGTQAKIINKENHVIGKKVFATKNNDIYRQFFEVHPIVHPSCMIRRSLLPNKYNLYFDKFGVNDDYYTFFTLLKLGKFANLPEFLLNYRIHFANSSLQQLKKKFFNTVKIRILAVTKLGYKPTIAGVVKLIIQIVLVTPIPESMLFTVYLLAKRIYTPYDLLTKSFAKLDFAFTRVRSFSSSLLS